MNKNPNQPQEPETSDIKSPEMIKPGHKFVDGIGEAFGRGMASHMVMVLFSVIALPFFYFGEIKNMSVLRGLGIAIFVTGLFVSRVTVPQVLKRLSEDPTLSFKLAASHTIYSHIGFLCFIPLIGPVLQRLFIEEKSANPFTVEDDPSKKA